MSTLSTALSRRAILEVGQAIHTLRMGGDAIVTNTQAAETLLIRPVEAGKENLPPGVTIALRFLDPSDAHALTTRVWLSSAGNLPDGWASRPLAELAAALEAHHASRAATPLEMAAIQLSVLAEQLPALYSVQIPSSILSLPTVDAAWIDAYPRALAQRFRPVAEAFVPLEGAENARVVAFQAEGSAVEHLAIVIGDPASVDAPLVRLHSSCLSGDILASLRCDCGHQLHHAIATIGEAGHGVVLYLQQEGRGIGLTNKLRAYRLQDEGMDTAEANLALGHSPDARDFATAAHLLKLLNINKIRLLSNNPSKIKMLAAEGIDVIERIPIIVSANPHNTRYLDTKRARFGHLL